MLTAAVASSDINTSAQLQALLQQTGLVSSVEQWNLDREPFADGQRAIPDFVVLDLPRDADQFWTLAAALRRQRPNVRLLACTSTQQDSQLLLRAMRVGVQDVLSKPIDLNLLTEVLSRLADELQSATSKPAGDVTVVMGSKGGVGATTIAVNVSVQMARSSKDSVLLLDMAAPLGAVQLLLDLKPSFGIRDAVENLERLDAHFFNGLLTHHGSSLQVLTGATQLEHWQSMPVSSLSRIVNVARTSHANVVIDYGSQFSGEWAPVLRQSTIMLITEANVPALWALERRLFALAGFGINPDQIRIVVNRWHRTDEATLKSVEKNIKRSISAYIPNDFARVSEAVNIGVPLSGNHNNLVASKFKQLAAETLGLEMDTGSSKRNGLTGLFRLGGK
jgi:pilus assembly protein CpaE